MFKWWLIAVLGLAILSKTVTLLFWVILASPWWAPLAIAVGVGFIRGFRKHKSAMQKELHHE